MRSSHRLGLKKSQDVVACFPEPPMHPLSHDTVQSPPRHILLGDTVSLHSARAAAAGG